MAGPYTSRSRPCADKQDNPVGINLINSNCVLGAIQSLSGPNTEPDLQATVMNNFKLDVRIVYDITLP